jgi:hypothetical protein
VWYPAFADFLENNCLNVALPVQVSAVFADRISAIEADPQRN